MARVAPILRSDSMRKMMQIAKDQSQLEEMLKKKKKLVTRRNSASGISTFVFVIFMVHLNACFFTYVTFLSPYSLSVFSLTSFSENCIKHTHTHTTGSSHRTSRTNTLHGCNKQISTANHLEVRRRLRCLIKCLPSPQRVTNHL